MGSIGTAANLIASERQKLGLSPSDVAKKTGLSIHEYGDIEQHAREIIDVTDLRQVRKILDVLGLSMARLLSAAGFEAKTSSSMTQPSRMPRSALVEKHRGEKRLSREDLADLIGYDVEAVVELERDPEFLERWPIGFAAEISAALDIPLGDLVSEQT